jgi:hypothetical protein
VNEGLIREPSQAGDEREVDAPVSGRP